MSTLLPLRQCPLSVPFTGVLLALCMTCLSAKAADPTWKPQKNVELDKGYARLRTMLAELGMVK